MNLRSLLHIVSAIVASTVLTTAFCATAQAEDTIAVEQLLGTAQPGGLVPNTAFLPSAAAGPAKHDFTGALQLEEITMGTSPASFRAPKVMGKDPKVFPAVNLSFFVQNGDLVPVDRDVIRLGSTPAGSSYWTSSSSPAASGRSQVTENGRGLHSRFPWSIRSKAKPTTGSRPSSSTARRFRNSASRSCSKRHPTT